jgi:dTDP-4-amino-4,6-dideoxygalactose transaminase
MLNSDRPAILGGEPICPSGSPPWPGYRTDVAEAVSQSLHNGSWGHYCGPNHARLEQQLAMLHGCEHVLLCASGTAAVELALRGARVGVGDEVILAAYDFKANFQNVLTVGAVPVLVDVRADNWQFDDQQLSAAISEKTRAIVVSHLHGAFADISAVNRFASNRNLIVIEDACQCPGALLGEQRAGSIGHVGVLSFGGSKLLSAGRGGAVLTNQPEIAQRIKLHTQRGNEAYPLSELQAAALVPQVETLDEYNRRRLLAVQFLVAELVRIDAPLKPITAVGWVEARDPSVSDRDDVGGSHSSTHPTRDLQSAVAANQDQPAFYKVGFQYDSLKCGDLNRDHFSAAMRAEGIAIDPGFRGLHLIHSRRRFRAVGELTNATQADAQMLILHHPMLLEGNSAVAEFIAACERIRAHASDIRELTLPPA